MILKYQKEGQLKEFIKECSDRAESPYRFLLNFFFEEEGKGTADLLPVDLSEISLLGDPPGHSKYSGCFKRSGTKCNGGYYQKLGCCFYDLKYFS